MEDAEMASIHLRLNGVIEAGKNTKYGSELTFLVKLIGRIELLMNLPASKCSEGHYLGSVVFERKTIAQGI